jgi:hypothetical protein
MDRGIWRGGVTFVIRGMGGTGDGKMCVRCMPIGLGLE